MTSINFELFTIKDKYTLIIFVIIILIINILIFLELESTKNTKKYQVKSKKRVSLYVSSLAIIIVISLFITVPYLEQKTMITEEILCEGLEDNEGNYIKLVPIEETYYPTYNYSDSSISWYNKSVRNEKYLNSEHVDIYLVQRTNKNNVLYTNNESMILAIVNATKPKEYRGIETQSYWYSLIFVVYNLIIAILTYPLLSIYKKQIKIMWRTQNIMSSILLAIIISQTFIF